jgi:YfiH family protein
MTADCMPVLFCDRAGATVAAVHAGWRGLAAGVLEETLKAIRVDTGKVLAWLGPAIGPGAYEVGEEVRQAFMAKDAAMAAAFLAGKPGKWMCDLYELARLKLAIAGVRHIHGGGFCTYEDQERFFSFRRDGECGRMATLIWLD